MVEVISSCLNSVYSASSLSLNTRFHQILRIAESSHFRRIWTRFCVLFAIFSITQLSANSYYRLQGYDSSYRLLDDAPITQKKKSLKSHNSQNRTPRPKREQSTRRIDISPPASRNGSNSNKWDSSRLNPTPNEPARIRYGFPPYPRQHFLLLGLNTGIDLYTQSTAGQDNSKHIGIELGAKIGYLYYFTKSETSHAMRIYANFGTSIPTSRALPLNLAVSGNVDFLFNVIYFDIYLGGGYGGEYFASQGFFAHGALLNTGFSKRIGNHQLEVGVRVPFYPLLMRLDSALNHNIDFILTYNYRF